jgi:hypothetical protein
LAFLGSACRIILLAFATMLSQPVSAGSNMIGMSGNSLYAECTNADMVRIAKCEGYILGVQDAIYSGYLTQYFSLCFPPAVEVQQLRLQLIKFIENNPDLMNFAAEGLVAKSLENKYACKAAE